MFDETGVVHQSFGILNEVENEQEQRDQLAIEGVDDGKDEHDGEVDVHLSDEAGVNVDARQAVGVALVEVKQLPGPEVQENFRDGPLAGVFDHPVASVV